MIDASARPTIAQSLEMEVAVQEYCVAAARAAAEASARSEANGEAAADGRPEQREAQLSGS